MQIKSDDPTRFITVSIAHSRLVEGTTFPKPAPAKVVRTK
jgi:hypothetical protein